MNLKNKKKNRLENESSDAEKLLPVEYQSIISRSIDLVFNDFEGFYCLEHP